MTLANNLALLTLVTAALHLPVRKEYNHRPDILSKRSSWQSVIREKSVAYLVDIEIGTPPQKQTVVLDTGSSDLWVATTHSCSQSANSKNDVGCSEVYDTIRSASLINTTIPFTAHYEDGTIANGFYIQDTISLAGTSIDNANCAYADRASAPPTLGLGFVLNQPCVYYKNPAGGDWTPAQESCTPYKNIPQQMRDQGKISSTAYSIWLNDLSVGEGNILFGGVDHAKYRGPLVSLPIEAEPTGYATDGSVLDHHPEFTRTLVTLNQVKVISDNGTSAVLLQGAVPVLLDTGSTECSLPSALVKSLAYSLNAYSDGNRRWIIDCSIAKSTYIALNFRGLEIQVPISQFAQSLNGGEQCYLGAVEDDTDAIPIIGDNVLSSVYAVFDLERGQIALAPAIYNQPDTNIEDIVDSVPLATQAPAYSYSFSSYLKIDSSPTLVSDSGAAPPVQIRTDEARLTGTGFNSEIKESEARAGSFNGTVSSKPAGSSQDNVDNNGITNIISLATSLSLPEGISSVYSAGRPSIYGSSQTNAESTPSNSSIVAEFTQHTMSRPSTGGTSSPNTATGEAMVPRTASYNRISSQSPTSAVETDRTYAMPQTFTTGVSGGAQISSQSSLPSNDYPNTGGATSNIESVSKLDILVASKSYQSISANTTQALETTIHPSVTSFHMAEKQSGTTPSSSGFELTSCDPDNVVSVSESLVSPTASSMVTILTTYCPEPTIFTYGNDKYTINEATTLTVTYCDACRANPSNPNPSGSSGLAAGTKTIEASIFTTYCPEPTIFTYGNDTYTVTEATTLTITSCSSRVLTAPNPTFTEAKVSSFESPNNVLEDSVYSSWRGEISASDLFELSTEAPSTVASNGATGASVFMAMLLGGLL